MRKLILLLILCISLAFNALAQQPKDIMKDPIPIAMFQATYAFHIPAFDLKKDYGVSNTIGGSFIYKTETNWLFTLNGNFIFGNQLKGSRIDIFGEGITTTTGEIIGGGGLYSSLALFQRGMHLQAEIGKLFAVYPNPNSGIFVQGGIGYLRNRIRVDYQIEALNTPYQLINDYQYGYDQMRGGPAFHLETGYLVMSDSKVLNFSISLEATYARTRHLRDYDFRVFYDENGEPQIMGYTDRNKRFNDFYYGIRLSWMIPTYQRQPDAYYYY